MSRSSLAAVAALLLAACAGDRHGDLRTRVTVHPVGAPARVTFDGVGVGSPRADAAAAFGDGWVPPVAEADFGTRLTTQWRAREDGTVGGYWLDYGGSPVAVSRLAARWKEVFLAAGGECIGSGYCDLTDQGAVVATFSVHRRWLVPSSVTVHVDR